MGRMIEGHQRVFLWEMDGLAIVPRLCHCWLFLLAAFVSLWLTSVVIKAVLCSVGFHELDDLFSAAVAHAAALTGNKGT
jgi:hypothetical protein